MSRNLFQQYHISCCWTSRMSCQVVTRQVADQSCPKLGASLALSVNDHASNPSLSMVHCSSDIPSLLLLPLFAWSPASIVSPNSQQAWLQSALQILVRFFRLSVQSLARFGEQSNSVEICLLAQLIHEVEHTLMSFCHQYVIHMHQHHDPFFSQK